MRRRLAVLGSPIAHSRSPALHDAAYRVLGLDWDYGRAEVTEATLPGFLAGLGPEWVGLSLTMPLKRAVLPLIPAHDVVVDRLGLANTVLLGDPATLHNTDVPAIVEVLGPVAPGTTGLVLGAGATAASALEALAVLGVEQRIVAARDPERASRALAGAATGFRALDGALRETVAAAGVVVSTLPGGADAAAVVPDRLDGRRLLDVAYDPWPSPLGTAWERAGGELLHGLDMLLAQAVRQVRLFVAGDQEVPLPHEEEVVTAMRAVR